MCAKTKTPSEFNSLIQVATYFDTEEKCLEHLFHWLWKGVTECPHCGHLKAYRLSGGKKYKCAGCRQPFSLKVGTIFEGSKLPLQKWFMAIYLLGNNKKGISSYQLASSIGVTQKTAWYISQKIRSTFDQGDDKLEGEVQIDETFIGGKNKNRHIDKKVKNVKDRTFKDKVTAIGFLNKEGLLRCEAIGSTKIPDLQPAVRRNVKEGSMLITDEWGAYTGLRAEYDHSVVNHIGRKFINELGKTTNRIENVWSILKRVFIGTYNFVTRKHIQRYLDEITFRYNNRTVPQGTKLVAIICNAKGGITYKKIKNGKIFETAADQKSGYRRWVHDFR